MRPRGRHDYLFSNVDWFTVQQNQQERMLTEIDEMNGNRLLNTSADDLCTYFVEKYRIDVPVLQEDAIVVDQHEVQIDVSHDPRRAIMDRSRPFYVAGTAIEITVPFTGEAEAFRIQPTTFSLNPPRASVENGTITLTIEGTTLDASRVRASIDSELS